MINALVLLSKDLNGLIDKQLNDGMNVNEE